MEFSNDLIISLSLNLILFIILILLFIYINKIKNRIEKFLPKDKNLDIEKMIIKYNQDILKVFEKENEIFEKIELNKIELEKSIHNTNYILNETKNQLRFAIQKIGLINYNPFDNVGGEFCFALCLLDEQNNGIVINNIYTRENSYSYIKHITNGVCIEHKLSEEEQQSIKLAIENYKK